MPIDSVLIGIGGGSGSGKTYFLNKLLAHYPSSEIALISQDHYYKPLNEQAIDENGEVNFDRPEGLDDEQLYSDLVRLLSGTSVEKLEYTFNQPGIKPEVFYFQPHPILVLEGLFIFHNPKIRELLDLKVFVEAEESICLDRRIKRDLAERSYSPEQVRYQWKYHVMPAYESFLLPYRKNADLILENNGGEPDISVLIRKIEEVKAKRKNSPRTWH